MLMHSLLEYSDNYSMASASLWNHYRDEVNDHNTAGSYRINNKKTKQVYPFSMKQKQQEAQKLTILGGKQKLLFH